MTYYVFSGTLNPTHSINQCNRFRFCDRPASVGAFEWPDDITQWPVFTVHFTHSHGLSQ